MSSEKGFLLGESLTRKVPPCVNYPLLGATLATLFKRLETLLVESLPLLESEKSGGNIGWRIASACMHTQNSI